MPELEKKVFEALELALKTGKVKKGANETTKALERGLAKFVIIAKDVSPPEITMHLSVLAKEKGVPIFQVEKKEDLGSAVGLEVATSSVAVIDFGEAEKLFKEIELAIKK